MNIFAPNQHVLSSLLVTLMHTSQITDLSLYFISYPADITFFDRERTVSLHNLTTLKMTADQSLVGTLVPPLNFLRSFCIPKLKTLHLILCGDTREPWIGALPIYPINKQDRMSLRDSLVDVTIESVEGELDAHILFDAFSGYSALRHLKLAAGRQSMHNFVNFPTLPALRRLDLSFCVALPNAFIIRLVQRRREMWNNNEFRVIMCSLVGGFTDDFMDDVLRLEEDMGDRF